MSVARRATRALSTSGVRDWRVRRNDAEAPNGKIRNSDPIRFIGAQHLEYDRLVPPFMAFDQVAVSLVKRDRYAVVSASERETVDVEITLKTASGRQRRHGGRQMMRIGSEYVVAKAVAEQKSDGHRFKRI